MTCIVGLKYKDNIYLGADSCGANTATYQITTRKDKKIIRNGPYLIGYTTSFRMGQLLAYKFKPPKINNKIDLYTFMVTDFIDSIRDCFKDSGYSKIINNEESGGDFLVAVNKRLFLIESDFEVGENIIGFDAIGCGAPYALGSLYTTKTHNNQKQRVELALKTATNFSAYVLPPFHIEKL